MKVQYKLHLRKTKPEPNRTVASLDRHIEPSNIRSLVEPAVHDHPSISDQKMV